ncbi:MAG: hypothetical protein ABIH72_01815 [archaeon]
MNEENTNADIGIEPEIVCNLLSKVYSRNFGDMTVNSYEAYQISPEENRKSRVFRVKVTGYDMPSDILIKPVTVFKIYDGENGEYEKEFRVEKAVLGVANNIKVSTDGREVRIFPYLYSANVPECDQNRIIIREYVPDLTLQRMVSDAVRRKEVPKWDDVKSSISSIALLHVASGIIERELLAQLEDYMSSEKITKACIKYCDRLYFGANGERLPEDKREKLGRAFKDIAETYIVKNDFKKVISGDIGACPHHVMKSRLLDAGETKKGPLVFDLALPLHPIFSKLQENGDAIEMNLETRAIRTLEEYYLKTKLFAEKLKVSPDYITTIDSAEFFAGLYAGALIAGTLRGSYGALAHGIPLNAGHDYWRAFLEDTDRLANLEKTVRNFLDTGYKIINGLENVVTTSSSLNEVREFFKKMEGEEGYKINAGNLTAEKIDSYVKASGG